MNEIDVYGIVSQGLNIANQKGAFNLDESATIAQALLKLKELLNLTEQKNDSTETK